MKLCVSWSSLASSRLIAQQGLAIGAGSLLAVDEGAEVEREIVWKDLPEAVQKTILAEAGKFAVAEIEEMWCGDTLYYEAEWVEGEQEVELAVAPDGRILARDVEDVEDADADENEGENEDSDSDDG